jgi:hypothetical protein
MFNPGVARTLQDQARQGLNTDPIDPTTSPQAMSSVPGISPPDLTGLQLSGSPVQRTRATAEGAVTGTLAGRLYRATTGELIFAASPSTAPVAQPAEDRAFVLLPNQTLAQLSGVTTNLPSGQPITISGQAFTYRSTAYLLPLSFAITREPEAASTAPHAPPASSTVAPTATGATGTNATTPPPANDPRVTDLINRLEQARQPRALDEAMLSASTTSPAPSPASPPSAAPSAADLRRSGESALSLSALAPEGTLIIRARARLVRPPWAGGRLAATFDNDPKSPGRGTMLLVPCRVLEQAEALSGQLGEDATFAISGRVTIHEGRNYLLPVLIQRLPRTDVTPGQ